MVNELDIQNLQKYLAPVKQEENEEEEIQPTNEPAEEAQEQDVQCEEI